MIRESDPAHVDDLLPGYLSGTLEPSQAAVVAEHLSHCSACQSERADWEAVGAAARTVAARLPAPPRGLLDRAWIKIEQAAPGTSGGLRPRHRVAALLGGRRLRLVAPIGAGVLAASVAGVMLLTLAGVHATSLFRLFEPKQFAAVPVSFEDLSSLSDLAHYGTLTGPTARDPQQVGDATAAAAASGMTVLSPASFPEGVSAPAIYSVLPGNSASFTFNAEKARAAAESRGLTLPAMPQDVDGTTLEITTAPVVISSYLSGTTATGGASAVAGFGLSGIPRLIVGQTTAPAVTSNGAQVATLEQYLLSQPGISRQLADAVRALGDPATSWPIPVPINLAVAHPVRVQGVSGLAIGGSTGFGGGLLWQKEGTIYAVAGTLTEKELLTVANSLR